MDPKLIEKLLREVKYPNLDRDLIEYGVVQGVEIKDDVVDVTLDVLARDDKIPAQIKADVEAKLAGAGLTANVIMNVKQFPQVSPDMKSQTPTQGENLGPHGTSSDPWADRQRLPQIKFVLAVSSGKGGVGKSTVAVNLALALKFQGLTVSTLR